MSERPRAGSRARSGNAADGGPADGGVALPADYRSTFTRVNRGKLAAQGHGGLWDIEVWANQAAVTALTQRTRSAPVGSFAVAEHVERSDARARGPVFAMEKRAPGYAAEHGDWRYIAMGSRGELAQEAALTACAACHDDSPMDGLFPIVE